MEGSVEFHCHVSGVASTRTTTALTATSTAGSVPELFRIREEWCGLFRYHLRRLLFV